MGLFTKKKKLEDMKQSEMTASEREAHIGNLEADRDNIIYQIEDVLAKLARETGKKKLIRRKFKQGQSPNDRAYRP